MNDDKPILSIETSQNLCGACVYFDDERFFEANIYLKNAHAEKLFESIEYVLKSAGVNIEQIGAIAVSSGPGSFTGLRIGMSAAKGIAFGASLSIIPVPTFEALAMQISLQLANGMEFVVANKVNVDEIYYAKFQIKSNNYIFVDNLKIVKLTEFRELQKGCLTFGNAIENSGLNQYCDRENKPFIQYAWPLRKLLYAAPSPVFIAKWGKTFGLNASTFNYDYLEPNYLKNFIIKERPNV